MPTRGAPVPLQEDTVLMLEGEPDAQDRRNLRQHQPLLQTSHPQVAPSQGTGQSTVECPSYADLLEDSETQQHPETPRAGTDVPLASHAPTEQNESSLGGAGYFDLTGIMQQEPPPMEYASLPIFGSSGTLPLPEDDESTLFSQVRDAMREAAERDSRQQRPVSPRHGMPMATPTTVVGPVASGGVARTPTMAVERGTASVSKKRISENPHAPEPRRRLFAQRRVQEQQAYVGEQAADRGNPSASNVASQRISEVVYAMATSALDCLLKTSTSETDTHRAQGIAINTGSSSGVGIALSTAEDTEEDGRVMSREESIREAINALKLLVTRSESEPQAIYSALESTAAYLGKSTEW
eukprot:scaffold382_cov380-Prasinococcus_capsulatus_cf.AAC.42